MPTGEFDLRMEGRMSRVESLIETMARDSVQHRAEAREAAAVQWKKIDALAEVQRGHERQLDKLAAVTKIVMLAVGALTALVQIVLPLVRQ